MIYLFAEERHLRANDRELNLSFKYAVSTVGIDSQKTDIHLFEYIV